MTGAIISLRPWGYTLSVWLEGNLSAEEVNRIDAALISTIGIKGTFFHYKVHSEQRQMAAAAKAKAVPAVAVDEVGARTGTRTKKVVVDPDDSTPRPHARSLPSVSTPPSCPPDTALLRRWPAAVARVARAWSAARARSVCESASLQ